MIGLPKKGGLGKGGIGFSPRRSVRKTYLVNHTVPRKARVVDYDMNLALSKLCRFLDQLIDVLRVHHVAGYS